MPQASEPLLTLPWGLSPHILIPFPIPWTQRFFYVRVSPVSMELVSALCTDLYQALAHW